MDFTFFETLSKDDAERFLANFLSVESRVIDETMAQAESEGVTLILGTSSIKPMLSWIFQKLKTTPKAADMTLPHWISATDSYKRGLFNFDQPSKILILRAAYFLGASFVRDYSQLCWGTGKRETALQNMPVIKGFKLNLEMPPILVTQNLAGRIQEQNAPISIVDTAIETWISKI